MPRAIEVVDLDRIGERVLVGRAEAREICRERERALIMNLGDEVAGLIERMLQVERDDFCAIVADLVRRAREKQHIAGEAADAEVGGVLLRGVAKENEIDLRGAGDIRELALIESRRAHLTVHDAAIVAQLGKLQRRRDLASIRQIGAGQRPAASDGACSREAHREKEEPAPQRTQSHRYFDASCGCVCAAR